MIILFLKSLVLKSWGLMTIPLFIIFYWITWVKTPIISIPLVFLGSLQVLLGSAQRFTCALGAYSHQTQLMALPGVRYFIALQINQINSKLFIFLLLLIRVLTGTLGTSRRQSFLSILSPDPSGLFKIQSFII